MNKCKKCFVTLQFAVQAVILHIIHNQKLPIRIMNSFRSATKFAVKSLNGLVHIIIIFFGGGFLALFIVQSNLLYETSNNHRVQFPD